MKTFGIFFLASAIIGIFHSTAWSVSASDIQTLIRAAEIKNIESSRQWEKLLHIERNAVALKASQIIDKNFFLAQGPLEKQSELEATLRSFFAAPETFAEHIEPPVKKSMYQPGEKILDHSRHAICRFPARLKFLRENLSDYPAIWSQLPQVQCTFQKIYLDALDPAKINFVFSSYYSDSPGSAFGHTFFRVLRKSNLKAQQELLDYGVSFAANVTTSNGFLYAILGLVGGFQGTWTNMPYYYKVREYNDFESRDLWSYELNLSPDEVDMFALHMWEVGAAYYRYFFFSQNCAFQMLTALEAAAPRLHLSDKVPFYYTLPSDSLKALQTEPGLVTHIQFRPSLRKNFLARLERLDKNEIQDLKKYIDNTADSSVLADSIPQKAAYKLDAALDYLDLKFSTKLMKTESPEFKLKESLLNDRAQVDFITPSLSFKIENQEDPALSHGSSRVSVLASNIQNEYFFSYRFALHDLLDPVYGLPDNSQLEFGNFRFRVRDNQYYLNNFYFFRVMNLNPWTFYDHKPSWGVDIGAEQQSKNCQGDLEGCLLYGGRVKAGGSVSFSPFGVQNFLWAMAVGQARYSTQLQDRYDFLSAGAEVGFLTRLPDDFSVQGTYTREYPLEMKEFETYDVKLRKSFRNKWALAIEYENDIKSAGFYYFF